MNTKIQQFLKEIEARFQVEILYACESGSRAWGFPSPDSDYDVRFIYRHPRDWYLSLEEKSDTIHQMPSPILDGHGWDFRKFCRLAYRSNAVMYEWLYSPIIYRNTPLLDEMRKIVQPYFNQKKIAHHYLGIANNMLSSLEQGKEIKIKKYFYMLRPVLACKWVLKYGTVPPVTFNELLPLLRGKLAVNNALETLLAQKANAMEGDTIKPVPVLNEFIKDEISTCTVLAKQLTRERVSLLGLDEFYKKFILDL